MRITFPALSSTTAWNVCYQAALACLPLAVDLIAKNFFKEYTSARLLSWAVLPTLKNNHWSLGSGTILLIAHQLYSYWEEGSEEVKLSKLKHKTPASDTLPVDTASESNLGTLDPKDVIINVWNLISHIEQGIGDERIYVMGGADSIRTHLDFLTAFSALANFREVERARKAGAILKGYLRCLKIPLLEPIAQDLLSAHADPAKRFNAAIEKLEPKRKELFVLIFNHFVKVAQNSGQNKLTSQKLAAIFEPILFEIKETSSREVEQVQASHLAILAHLIEPAAAAQTLPPARPQTSHCVWETQHVFLVASRLIVMIEEKGIGEKNLYGITGNEKALKKLDELYSTTRSAALSFDVDDVLDEIALQPVHTWTTLIKRILQRLENPLVESIGPELKKAYAFRENQLEAFQNVIAMLSLDRQRLFLLFLRHLKKVVQNSSTDSKSLALTFAPLFFNINVNQHPLVILNETALWTSPLGSLIDNGDKL
jgi:hypothetical protein